MKNELSKEMIDNLRRRVEEQHEVPVVQRAVIKNGVYNASENDKVRSKLNRTFSIELDTGKVSNQRHSGRCWIFSTMNILRHHFSNQYEVKDFEFSQAYIYFWDKIERANMFYQRIIDLADRELKDRELQFYLNSPNSDGGQWAMAAAIVQKYGVVPNDVMPETFNTKDTTGFANALNLKLRRDAIQLRQMKHRGASEAELQAERELLLGQVYQMTTIAVGTPPESFDFEYKDDNQKYHIDRNITPLEFYDKYVGVDLDDYVVVTNSPDKPFNQLYSLPSQDNVIGGKEITFLNLPIQNLKELAVDQLKDGESIWFGNDVLEQMNRKDGLLDSELYKQDELFGVALDMTKAERMLYRQANVSHAMTLTGVDLIDGKTSKWKVENSWGEQNGDKGYFVMADNWFDDYVYEIVIQRKFLTKEQLEIADSTPTPLKAWDALA